MGDTFVSTLQFTTEILTAPFLIGIALAVFGLILCRSRKTRDIGTHLVLLPAGAIAGSLLSAIVIGTAGFWWADKSVGNDGPGLIAMLAYIAAYPLGGIAGLALGNILAKRALQRQPPR